MKAKKQEVTNIVSIIKMSKNLRLVSSHLNTTEKNLKSRPRGYNTFFSCPTRLSMKFVLLINLNLPTTANSCSLNLAEHEHFSEKCSCSAELSMKKVYIYDSASSRYNAPSYRNIHCLLFGQVSIVFFDVSFHTCITKICLYNSYPI